MGHILNWHLHLSLIDQSHGQAMMASYSQFLAERSAWRAVLLPMSCTPWITSLRQRSAEPEHSCAICKLQLFQFLGHPTLGNHHTD